MGKNRLSSTAYETRTVEAAREGGVTAKAEQQVRSGGGLDPLVDPSSFGVIRESRPRYSAWAVNAALFERACNSPMLVETLTDTTGSMGENVQIAFDVLPITYGLLVEGKVGQKTFAPVLGAYDLQIINGIFGDRDDRYIFNRSQAEMDDRIIFQMSKLVPEKQGHDYPEDPEYGLFGAAYLTKAVTNAYGLKTYHFVTSDAPGRWRERQKQFLPVELRLLKRVFGEDVVAKVKENGHSISEKELPAADEIVRSLSERAHAFALVLVEYHRDNEAIQFWTEAYGKNHVVIIQSTQILPYVYAAIIGLTEGIITLSGVKDYLVSAGCSQTDAAYIAKAVAHIPVGAQKKAKNFGKLPGPGTVFRKKTDLWPLSAEDVAKLTAYCQVNKVKDPLSDDVIDVILASADVAKVAVAPADSSDDEEEDTWL